MNAVNVYDQKIVVLQGRQTNQQKFLANIAK